MKIVLWAMSLILSTSAAWGDSSFHCRSDLGKYAVFVWLSSPPSGRVLVNDKQVPLGDLTCTDDSQNVKCTSTDVVDDGYSVLIEKGEDVFPGFLYEVSLSGEKKLADMTCHYVPLLFRRR